MSAPVPSVGRIVRYVSHGSPVLPDGSQTYPSVCRAAIITEVPEHLLREPLDGCPNGTQGEWIASLAVLNPSGIFFDQAVPYAEPDGSGLVGGTWHWPERV
ncbi:hypothetical protein ACWF94_06150 [Streptomyces sp. NPDC055078]